MLGAWSARWQYACSSWRGAARTHQMTALCPRSPPAGHHPRTTIPTGVWIRLCISCRAWAKLPTTGGRLCGVNHTHVTMPAAVFETWLLSARDVKHGAPGRPKTDKYACPEGEADANTGTHGRSDRQVRALSRDRHGGLPARRGRADRPRGTGGTWRQIDLICATQLTDPDGRLAAPNMHERTFGHASESAPRLTGAVLSASR